MPLQIQMRVAFFATIYLLFCMPSSTVLSQQISATDLHYSVEDITPFFVKEFEKAYGKEKLREISYDMISFSPEGGFLAVAISQITIGDPEQVWLIDLTSHNVRLVTEPVIKGKVGLHIGKLSWESEGVLHVTVHRIDWLNQANNRTISIRATINESQQTIISNPTRNNELAIPSPSQQYEIIVTPPSIVEILDMKSNDILFRTENAYWEPVRWLNDNLFVFVTGQGHGSFMLHGGEIKPKTRTFKIDSGSWELLEFVADQREQSRIAYLKHLDDKNNAIIFYDLNRKTADRTLYVRQWPWRVALSNKNQLAFTSKSCEIAAERFTSQAIAAQEATRKLCITQLHDSQKRSFMTSFDCAKAGSDVEKTICGVKELADADVEMASIYGSLLSRLSGPEKNQLKREQLAWLKERNTSCGTSEKIVDCIRDFYKKRIETLKKQK